MAGQDGDVFRLSQLTFNEAIPTVDAQLAYDCLTSAPLDSSAASDLVNSIIPYLPWQSGKLDPSSCSWHRRIIERDLSYLKNPPAGYMQPAIDIYANLSLILNNIKSGHYKNEHAFQPHLYKTFQAVHDGHFRFAPDLLTKALVFRRPIEIVSVSEDGIEVPKVYTKGKTL